jgi:hypothetical protein
MRDLEGDSFGIEFAMHDATQLLVHGETASGMEQQKPSLALCSLQI